MIKKYVAKRRTKGSFLVEMAIVSWLLVYMLIGSFQIGMMLVRGIQAGEICANGNVLEIRGIDLSQTQNQELLLRTAPSLGINTPGSWLPSSTGAGLVVLSQVYNVGPLECSNGVANFDGTTATCPNLGQNVIAMRINIGNLAQGSSVAGNPSSTPGANGFLTPNQICTVTGNVAAGNFSNVISLTADQYTWVSEVFANSNAYNLFALMRSPTIYMRNLS
jgi:hypothetical protein